jgi:dUTP pyrophosphatase
MEVVCIEMCLEEGIQKPEYQTSGAAGVDLRSVQEVKLLPLERGLFGTGIRVAIPTGFEGQIRPRSGLALKYGLSIVNSPGTIDSDYRGEIQICLINLSQDTVELARGERIAQLVICPIARADFQVVASLTETERGLGGYGSTGTG